MLKILLLLISKTLHRFSTYHKTIRNLALISKGDKPNLYSPINTQNTKQTEIQKNRSVLELDRTLSKYLTNNDSSIKLSKIIKVAENSVFDHKREDWLKRRNRIASGADSVSFMKFLKSLFEALDDDNSDTLEAKELITHLLAVGIAPEASFIEKALLASFYTDDISGIQMSKKQFMDLFKMDRKTDHILTLLNEYTQESLRKLTLSNLARCMASSNFLKRSSRDKIVYPPKISLNEIANHTLTKANTTTVKDESCPNIHAEKLKLDLKYCSMVDSAKVIEEWWSKFKKDSDNLVNINIITQFLSDMKFTMNVHEARAYILSIKKPHQRNKISKDHFGRLFAKAVFKGALKNIAYGLSSGEFANDDTPLRMKLAMYQRRLMLSGMNLKPGESNKKGKQTLIALYNYTKFDGNEESMEEIYKRMNTRNFREERMKVANEIVQDKNSKNHLAMYEYSKSYMDKFKETELQTMLLNTTELTTESIQCHNLDENEKLMQIETSNMKRSKSIPKKTSYKILNREVKYYNRTALDVHSNLRQRSEEKYTNENKTRSKKFIYNIQGNRTFVR